MMMIGDKIFLRAVENDDLNFLFELENDMELWQYGTCITPLSKDSIKQFIKDSHSFDIYTTRQLRLIICRNDSKSSVGCIDITDFDPQNRHATLGIVILKNERNNGFADEALKIVERYAFMILNINQLYCEITDNNEISLSLFLRNGFQISGTKKSWIIIDNNWHDVFFLQKINKK